MDNVFGIANRDGLLMEMATWRTDHSMYSGVSDGVFSGSLHSLGMSRFKSTDAKLVYHIEAYAFGVVNCDSLFHFAITVVLKLWLS